MSKIPPDLILLDINMPKMDGFEVCRRLKEDPQAKFIPVVMVTALKEIEDRVKSIECGADDFLTKPFNKYELMARVNSLLRIKFLHDELEQKNELLSKILNRYVAKEVSMQILEDPERHLKLGGERRIVTVMFADIRGFTKFTESHRAEVVVKVLNMLFSELTKVVTKHKGTFDKYIGDSIMAFFGAPVKYDDDVTRALRAALEMQEVMSQVKKKWVNDDIPDLKLGIGINTGAALVGNIGSEKIMDYTVIGDVVNVAERIQALARDEYPLISKTTYLNVKDQVEAEKMPPQEVSGKQESIVTYKLKKFK